MGVSSKAQRSASSCLKAETVADVVAEEAEGDVEGSETCSVTTVTSLVICHVTAEAGEHLGEDEEEGGPDLALHHDAEDRTHAREADRLKDVANLLEADLHPEAEADLRLQSAARLQHGAAFPHESEVFPLGREAFPHSAVFLPGEAFPQESKRYAQRMELPANLSTTRIMKMEKHATNKNDFVLKF